MRLRSRIERGRSGWDLCALNGGKESLDGMESEAAVQAIPLAAARLLGVEHIGVLWILFHDLEGLPIILKRLGVPNCPRRGPFLRTAGFQQSHHRLGHLVPYQARA